ncbi:MAG: hypothetical protein AABZ55_06340 [Bdellovibrionota bacterium]
MLRLLGWLIRAAVFALVVLVLGNWFQYKGKTLSDQVRTGMAQAERTSVYKEAKTWANQVKSKTGFNHKVTKIAPKANPEISDEDLPASERQKLKALIHELNGSNQ